MIVIVMGVCGAGKTTVGELIAEALGARFAEGDKFHPAANVEKMSRGEPLTDDDRWPWLESIGRSIDQWQRDGEDVVIACSALKAVYRDVLMEGRPGVRLVYLHGNEALLAERMAQREHHYMPASLLPSQIATLEPPAPSDAVLAVDVARPPEAVAADIMAWIGEVRH